VSRARLLLAASAFALLVVYASLVPLDEHPLSAEQAWALIAASWPPAITSKTDFAANLILQCPFGFLLTGGLTRDRRGRPLAPALLAVVIAATLAFGIEFAQGMFAARTPSLTDVLAETIGALGGALLWMQSGPWLAHLAEHRWRRIGSPALLVLGAYAGVWVLWLWMPFDFTLRVTELVHKYREGSIVLFADPPGAGGFALVVGRSARHWLLAVPFGAAAWLVTRDWRAAREEAALLLACGITLAVQLADVAVLTHAVDLGEVAAAGLGAAMGAWWAERPASRRGVAVAAAAVVALVLDQWAPFQFSAKPQAFGLLPFQSYLLARPSQALSEGLLKLQLGFAVAFVGWRGRRPAKLHALQWIGLAALVEAGQIFLAGRYADVTDVIIVSAGALIGLGGRSIFEPEREALAAAPTVRRSQRVRKGRR
jgi:VanZ family protein